MSGWGLVRERWVRNKKARTYRPTSKAGDAMGLSSVVMVKIPSNLRSGKGAVTEAEMRARTLILILSMTEVWRVR